MASHRKDNVITRNYELLDEVHLRASFPLSSQYAFVRPSVLVCMCVRVPELVYVHDCTFTQINASVYRLLIKCLPFVN